MLVKNYVIWFGYDEILLDILFFWVLIILCDALDMVEIFSSNVIYFMLQTW